MEIDIPTSLYDEIEQLIGSDASPVGIDAMKTHILHRMVQSPKRPVLANAYPAVTTSVRAWSLRRHAAIGSRRTKRERRLDTAVSFDGGSSDVTVRAREHYLFVCHVVDAG